MIGTVEILNVGEGDTKLTFDKSNPEERKRAAKIVKDMLKRGYALLIQIGEIDGEPTYRRVREFDPDTCEYIIATTDDEVINIGEAVEIKPSKKKSTRKKRVSKTRIPADKTRAVAVARTAGG